MTTPTPTNRSTTSPQTLRAEQYIADALGLNLNLAIDKYLPAGMRAVITFLDPMPGTSLQEKWVAANGDAQWERMAQQEIDVALTTSGSKAVSVNRHILSKWKTGIGYLTALGYLHPDVATVFPRKNRMILTPVLHLHATQIERIVSTGLNRSGNQTTKIVHASAALAALIATTGEPLDRIDPDQWAMIEKLRQQVIAEHTQYRKACKAAVENREPLPARPPMCHPSTELPSLQWAYGATVAAGVMPPRVRSLHPGEARIPPTLRIAGKLPHTNKTIVVPYLSVFGPRMLESLMIVLDIAYSDRDLSTRRALVQILATFWRAVTAELPGHDTLDIPAHARTRIWERFAQCESKDPSQPAERKTFARSMGVVQKYYEMVWHCSGRPEYPVLREITAVFPWDPSTISRLETKYKVETASRMTIRINNRMDVLPTLVNVAYEDVQEAEELLSIASTVPHGGQFTFRGEQFQRCHRWGRTSRPDAIRLRKVGSTAQWFDVTDRLSAALNALTLVAVLRHTGIRIEEASETCKERIEFETYNGVDVPLLVIAPSKFGTTRRVALHPEAANAIAALLDHYKVLYPGGEIPVAVRFDDKENKQSPNAHYLFQHSRHGVPTAFTDGMFRTLLNRLHERYNAPRRAQNAANRGNPEYHPQKLLEPLSPHDFRRLYCTDQLTAGVPLSAVMKNMGHLNASTTQIYDKRPERDALLATLDSWERDRT
jgi:integrase